MSNGRPVVLYHPQYLEGFRNALREARADLHQLHFNHLCELADVRAELKVLREVLEVVVSVTRQQAEGNLASLRRQLEVALARIERDPRKPLH